MSSVIRRRFNIPALGEAEGEYTLGRLTGRKDGLDGTSLFWGGELALSTDNLAFKIPPGKGRLTLGEDLIPVNRFLLCTDGEGNALEMDILRACSKI